MKINSIKTTNLESILIKENIRETEQTAEPEGGPIQQKIAGEYFYIE